MSLTPLEVENVQFSRRMFGGYDSVEVERFVALVAKSVEEYITRLHQLERSIEQLELEIERYRGNEDLLRSSVLHAQRAADELIAAARERAEAIRGEAELEAGKLRQGLSELKNEREQFEFAFHGLLSGFIRRLEVNNPALAPAAPIQALPAAQAEVQPDSKAIPAAQAEALATTVLREPEPSQAAQSGEDSVAALAQSGDQQTNRDPDSDDFARLLSSV